MRIIINPKYKKLESFITSIPYIFENEGTTIFKARNELKEYTVSDISIIVKRFRKPIFINRIIYTFFRPSKAKRSYKYGLIFQEKGISTPEPIAYIESHSQGLLSSSYYISVKSFYPYLFADLADKNFKNRETILKAYAEFVGEMHEKEVTHNDLSKSNILIKPDSGKIYFEVVDINRAHFGAVEIEKGCKDFNRTIGDDETLSKIAESYALFRGFNTEKCIDLILSYRNKFFAKKNIDKITGKIERKNRT